MATWNSNALFCYEPNQARKKRNKVTTLAQKHDIVLIQEAHGKAQDSRALEDILQETHRVFVSPHSSSAAGGLVTIIKKTFCSQFEDIVPVVLQEGRVMAIDLSGTKGNCRVTNVHIEPALSNRLQKVLLKQIINEAPLQEEAVHVIGGDFNFLPEGEMRLNADSGQWSNSDDDVAKVWTNLTSAYTEWHQENFTRGQRCEQGLILARLDRIYSNHFLIDIYIYI